MTPVKESAPELRWQSGDYDPTIQGLLAKTDSDWGDPETNLKNLIKWGVKPLDKALWGIDTSSGEMNLILGPEKQRKTTFILNIVRNIFKNKNPDVNVKVVLDSLESGSPPERNRDTLLSILASQSLMKQGHIPPSHGRCPVCGSEQCKELRISPEFLKFVSRSPAQYKAIAQAKEEMHNWNLNLYGASHIQGTTRDLKTSDIRWRYLAEQGYNIFVIDHVQQYNISETATDYEKQLQAVSKVGSFVAETKTVVFLLSQVSLWSQRDQGGIGLTASGGKKGHQEANSILSTKYEDNSGFVKITLEESRKSGGFAMYQKIDDESGAFFGEAYLPKEWDKQATSIANRNDLEQKDLF